MHCSSRTSLPARGSIPLPLNVHMVQWFVHLAHRVLMGGAGNLRELALARMGHLGLKCRDVRTREAGIQDIHHQVPRPAGIHGCETGLLKRCSNSTVLGFALMRHPGKLHAHASTSRQMVPSVSRVL
jgi:hypothetical protein